MKKFQTLAHYIVCVTTYFFQGYHVYGQENVILSTEGRTVRIPCPCRTEVGSFSKTDEKGTIWSNGIIAKDKKHEYSFTDGGLIIEQSTSNDSGTYTWVCDEDYRRTEVHLIVKDCSHLKVHEYPSVEKAVGENLTLTVSSNSTYLYTSITCDYSSRLNCSINDSSELVFDSSKSLDWNTNVSSTRSQRIRVVKRSTLDFDLVLQHLEPEDSGCYSCKEHFSNISDNDGQAVSLHVVQPRLVSASSDPYVYDKLAMADDRFTPFLVIGAVAFGGGLGLTTFLAACFFLVNTTCKPSGKDNYQDVTEENKTDNPYTGIEIREGPYESLELGPPQLEHSYMEMNLPEIAYQHVLGRNRGDHQYSTFLYEQTNPDIGHYNIPDFQHNQPYIDARI